MQSPTRHIYLFGSNASNHSKAIFQFQLLTKLQLRLSAPWSSTPIQNRSIGDEADCNLSTSQHPGDLLVIYLVTQHQYPKAKLYCLVTEAHIREKLAQNGYEKVECPAVEPATCSSQV